MEPWYLILSEMMGWLSFTNFLLFFLILMFNYIKLIFMKNKFISIYLLIINITLLIGWFVICVLFIISLIAPQLLTGKDISNEAAIIVFIKMSISSFAISIFFWIYFLLTNKYFSGYKKEGVIYLFFNKINKSKWNNVKIKKNICIYKQVAYNFFFTKTKSFKFLDYKELL